MWEVSPALNSNPFKYMNKTVIEMFHALKEYDKNVPLH